MRVSRFLPNPNSKEGETGRSKVRTQDSGGCKTEDSRKARNLISYRHLSLRLGSIISLRFYFFLLCLVSEKIIAKALTCWKIHGSEAQGQSETLSFADAASPSYRRSIRFPQQAHPTIRFRTSGQSRRSRSNPHFHARLLLRIRQFIYLVLMCDLYMYFLILFSTLYRTR